jgi:hypothetical protein
MVVMGGHTFIRDDKLNFRTLRLFKGFGVGAPFFFIWDPHSIYIYSWGCVSYVLYTAEFTHVQLDAVLL